MATEGAVISAVYLNESAARGHADTSRHLFGANLNIRVYRRALRVAGIATDLWVVVTSPKPTRVRTVHSAECAADKSRVCDTNCRREEV